MSSCAELCCERLSATTGVASSVSVDTATDIARESVDIILLEKSLLVLDDGVLRGREVYGTIVKYITMTASSVPDDAA